ncbi:tripartite tricarboxylate transporter permease [Pelagibius litoralis]|uniref:Tripartite tricarboxylate transporter permease n=1 Tax=Pelagibius litoralis TaxID=374515 RepID=A0A967C3N0_9PROT|nr:tripartite tricarboxylate transporter permease [Pelagibius litoralis]NIA67680.1 tripartite tricarboxylate transporter permease [Pelagibius litoralis]
MIETLSAALASVLTFEVLLTILLSALYGLFVGSIPGLTATMSVALLVPITFFLDPVPAVAAIVTTTATAIFAGDIPGALLRIPGTPASAAYVNEAFALTQKGESEKGLGASLVTAAIGGVIGVLLLTLFANQLAGIAVRFSSMEYFWLGCLGLTSAVAVASASVLRSALSLLIGLMISTVGIDIATGHPRFTFGAIDLLDGVSFIPAMIGMFALSQILRTVTSDLQSKTVVTKIGSLTGYMIATVRRFWPNILRSSLLGNALGALPGAGADIAAWIAYSLSKRFSKTPEKFGTGYEEGIVDAGSANNSAVAGAWVPALVFGIPGDSVTAIGIGVLMLKGITPSPRVFQTDGDLIYAIFFAFIIANLIMLPLGILAIRSARHVLSVPKRILMPLILAFSILGAYAVDNTTFSIWVMLVLGLLAYFMESNDIPIAPAILGIVLGKVIEKNFLITMIKTQGDLLGFFERPIAAGLGIATVALWAYLCLGPLVHWIREKRH